MLSDFFLALQRYRTPPRSKSRSESEEERGNSETPPHWKEEMQRTKAYQPPSVERWSKGEKYVLHQLNMVSCYQINIIKSYLNKLVSSVREIAHKIKLRFLFVLTKCIYEC